VSCRLGVGRCCFAGGFLEFGGCDESVPVAVVGEVEEGVVDCGGRRVDDGVAQDGEGW